VAARDKEVRERADAKADEVVTKLELLEKLLLSSTTLSPYVWPEDREQAREAELAVARLSRAALYLQRPLRRHVEQAARVLRDADQLAGERWVRDLPRTIVYVLILRTRDMVARYLRNEPVPTELSAKQQEYEEGWRRMQDYIDHRLEAQLDQAAFPGTDSE
jgi:hypothetical protein